MDPAYAQRSCNEMNYGQVIKLTKNFPMKAYIKGMGYGKSKKFNISNPAYIKKVDSLYTKKNLNSIKEYMLVGYILENIEFLDKKAFDVAIETDNMTLVRPEEKHTKNTAIRQWHMHCRMRCSAYIWNRTMQLKSRKRS